MTTEPDEPSTSTRKGYVLVQVEITDRDQYTNDYIPTAVETIDAHGGRVLVAEDDPHLLEGEWDYNWTVVVEFPSVEDAHAWYTDERYEAVKPIRHEATEAENGVIVPELPPE